MSASQPPLTAEESSRPHRAAQLEDHVNRFVASFFRARGWTPRVAPHAGLGGDGWIRVRARLQLAPPGSPDDVFAKAQPETVDEAIRGWRNFTRVIAPFAKATIRVGETEHRVASDRSGYIDARLPAHFDDGWHAVSIWADGTAPVTARLRVIGASTGLGVVSDIDDTVMITMLPRPVIAAWNAFVLTENARKVVPGMPQLYRSLQTAHDDPPFVYLSTGAWNVYGSLARFLERNGYPSGPMLLTDWGPTNTGWFRSGRQHKVSALERLADDFPGVQWLLFGDDGQHDPRIYADFARRHPLDVRGVMIRQLSPGEQVLAHGTPAAVLSETKPTRGGESIRLITAPDGTGLEVKMRREGLL